MYASAGLRRESVHKVVALSRSDVHLDEPRQGLLELEYPDYSHDQFSNAAKLMPAKLSAGRMSVVSPKLAVSVATGTSTLSVAELLQRSTAALRPSRPVLAWSKPAAIRALRAAVVMPGLFAIADELIGNLQVALFASFGSFATLVLVSFAGTRRDKLIAHAGLALAGSVLLIIGTAINSSTALAALVTVPLTFLVFFAGVAGPNAASGVTGALLAYVLPAASPGAMSMVGDRLAGWWLASIVGTAAVLAIPTPSVGDRLGKAAAKLAATLADELDAVLHGSASEAGLNACVQAKHELLTQFNATPFRPIGLAAPDQALANAVELLEWSTSLVADSVRERGDLHDAPPDDRELVSAAAAVLRQSGALLSGGGTMPDLGRLSACRRESTRRLAHLEPDGDGYREQVQLSFHVHAIAVTVLALGADATVAERLQGADWIADSRRRWLGAEMSAPTEERPVTGIARYTGIASRHASLRSVWFINSLRGALALAAAVAVADLSTVQHGFWVVLGTLSVLRTNAASTGATALRALLGTAVGFAIGAALLAALGSSSSALWVALPFAVLVAAYAPGAAPFALGQAAFTVTVVILFNLLVPVGWRVGELRIEDVAIGCAVSVVVGTLFWPRGVASVVGDDLADAYRSGAAYLTQAVKWVCGLRADAPEAREAAITAGLRLDDALRGFLTEQGTKHIAKEELWRLIGGTLRLRLTAHAVSGLPRGEQGTGAASSLGRWADVLDAFYERLAAQVGPRGQAAREQAIVRLTAPTFDLDGDGGAQPSRDTIWLHEHLGHLTEHLCELVAPAAHLAEIRRRPWWR